MNFKKITSVLLASTTALSMAACGNSQNTKKPETTTKPAESKATDKAGTVADAGNASNVELNVSIWDSNQEPGINKILADFTAKTGIKTKVSVVKWDEYWTMLAAGAQGGSLPDVFWMHSNESQRYMSNGMLLDISDKIKKSSEIKMENYPENIWDLYTYDKKQYAIPKDIDTIALWYNKKMFDEAGIKYPTADWTWDDVTTNAKKLTKADGSQYGLAVRNDNNQAGYYNLIYDAGGNILSKDKKKSGMDDPKTIEGMKTLETWIKDGSMPKLSTMAENAEDVLFTSGKVAMVLQGSWMVAAYKENEYTAKNCDVVELPKDAKTGRRVSLYNGLGWAASANGKHTEEAWKLMEYLGSKAAQEKQAELGVTMSAYKGTSDKWAGSAKFNLKAYLNMMQDMEIRPFSKTTVAWETENSNILKKVYSGEMSMEDACKAMAKQMNEKLAEE